MPRSASRSTRRAAGTPFFVRELANAVAEEGLGVTASDVPRLQELGGHGVTRAVSLRLSRLPRRCDEPCARSGHLRRRSRSPSRSCPRGPHRDDCSRCGHSLEPHRDLPSRRFPRVRPSGRSHCRLRGTRRSRETEVTREPRVSSPRPTRSRNGSQLSFSSRRLPTTRGPWRCCAPPPGPHSLAAPRTAPSPISGARSRSRRPRRRRLSSTSSALPKPGSQLLKRSTIWPLHGRPRPTCTPGPHRP